MAKLILKIEVKDGVRPSLVFASKSDTIGASGEFYAPTGWTASIQDGLVYLKKNTPETSTGFKNYTLDNFGWNYEKIAFPKQVVTRLSDEELFLNQSSKHTLSANSGVLTFKFKDDFVGLTSNDSIKLVKHMAYTLSGNPVNLQCNLLKTINGQIKIVADVSPGEYPYTFDGGSGVFEVVPNKLQLTTNVNRDDLKQKRMMSSKHIIDRTPYNDKYDHIIHNKRAVFIQVDNNFSFHGIGDFANYYKAKTIRSENIYMLPSIDTSFVFAGCYNLEFGLSKFNIKNAKTLIGYASGTKSIKSQIKFSPYQTIQASDLSYMFEYSAYNSYPIFKTDNLLKLESTFEGNEEFNNRVLHWDVSKVNNFKNLFKNTLSYNRPMWKWSAKIGSSDSVGEINMQGMFENSVFNQGINNWDVNKVSNFKNMFKNNTYFNKQLFNWKYKIGGWTGISSVNLEGMFENSVFNQGVAKWDVSKVSNFKNTFKNSQYNKPLEWAKTFDDAKITDLTGFLENTKINHWSLKKYDCRFQHLNGFDKIFGESLPVNSLANISPVAKFNYGSVTNDPCSNTGPSGPSGDTLQPLSMNNIDIQTFGNATNHLEQNTGYYQDLVDAIDYWNSAVSYPDWMQNQEPIQLRISIENPNQPGLNDNPPNLGDSTLANASITSFMIKPGASTSSSDIPWGDSMPFTGDIRINESYFTNNSFSQTDSSTNKTKFYYTIRHEIGHILGIGYFAGGGLSGSPITEYTEQDETKYYYNGSEGLIQYKSYITDDDVKNNIVGLPLEDDGGSGTANVHFEYGQLDGVTENNRYINGHWHPGLSNENMVGWIMLNGNGSPISRITLGVLQDFGWNVDMSKSEHFTLSSTIPSIEYNDDNAIYINVDRTNRIQFNFDMINEDDKITIEWRTSVTDEPEIVQYPTDGNLTPSYAPLRHMGTYNHNSTSESIEHDSMRGRIYREWGISHPVFMKITGNIRRFSFEGPHVWGKVNLFKINGMSSLSHVKLLGNIDLSEFDPSGLTSFEGMFKGVSSYGLYDYDLDITMLDETKVTNFRKMFAGWNGGKIIGIENWNLSHLDSSSSLDRSMFGYSNFNQDISGWNVENFTPGDKHLWTNPMDDIVKGTWHLDSAKVPKWGYSITTGASASAISMGATNISVSNASDFQVGDRLVVGRGTPNEERTSIVGNGTGDIVANDTNDEQQITVDPALSNAHSENTSLESRPPENASVEFIHDYTSSNAMFGPYEYGADIIDNSREFTVNATNIGQMYIQKLPALSGVSQESRPYKDFVVKVNDNLADLYYPIESGDEITIELPTDASFYGGHHTEELQIFANPNSGYKLSTDYQSANDSDAKIISIKCSVNVKCNSSICVKNNNETEESKYEGTWNLGTEDFTITLRTGRFDYEVEDITISNYYTFTYAGADEITGDSFEEKFILLETPRRLKPWPDLSDDKDSEWQLIGEMVYHEDDSTKIISSTLLGTASLITSSIGTAYGENVFSSCIGSLIPHTSYTPFYMMVGDTKLEFYEDVCDNTDGNSGPSGEDDTNDTDNSDNDDTGYDFVDAIISLDSANIIVNEDNEISLQLVNLTAGRTDLPNNWVENVDTASPSRITLVILKQDNNASIFDDNGNDDILPGNLAYEVVTGYESVFNTSPSTDVYNLTIYDDNGSNIPLTTGHWNAFFTDSDTPQLRVLFSDYGHDGINWTPRAELSFDLIVPDMQSNDTNNDDDGTSDDVTDKFDNPFGTFSIGSFSHWDSSTYDTWNGNYSADYILVDPAVDEFMYYVWKNDADNSLKIAVKYYKPNDFDPSNPSFMDITNQSNFIQGVYFLNSSCSGDDCNLVESHFLSTNLDEYGTYIWIQEDGAVDYGTPQQSPTSGMLWNLLGGMWTETNVVYTEKE